ncbi:hypothetical protein ACFSPU_04130 [Haoranjiania flava]|uniref:Uncharacterized protein n=1 Tax=Haoranjiania flava TaxID=1856322 RepID=A0AAE3INI0_9BACT|nr:hypothetical protein [Haoranjiania flava]MCU7694849.1 hypothetical protein [Haoranjiania flava]
MKKKKTLFICLLLLVIFSCNRKELDQQPVTIRMEAEGGEEDVRLRDRWQIAGIINKNGDVKMWGDIFSADGKLIAKNKQLRLDTTGILENNCFRIAFLQPDLIKVILKENNAEIALHFVILLQRGDKTKEISVSQSISQGYTFGGIEYALQEGDGDSLYKKSAHRITLKSHGTTGNAVSFDPLGGSALAKVSYFESKDEDAFMWLKQDSVKVRIPDIFANQLLLTPNQVIYGVVTQTPSSSNIIETVKNDIVNGESSYYTEVEFRKRTLSYTLTLINNRTKNHKYIKGKWIEHASTGNYKVIRVL